LPEINDRRVIHGNVNVSRVPRPDLDEPRIFYDFNLRSGIQIALGARHGPQALHRTHDLGGLIYIGLAEGAGPINFVGHHVKNGGVVRHGLNTYIPRLNINSVLTECTYVAGGLINLIRECCCRKNLGEQRIGIERNRSQQIVELLG